MSTIKTDAIISVSINGNLDLSANGTGGVKVSDYLIQTKGSDISSATALSLGKDGNLFDVTGTTTITSIGTQGIGSYVVLHFDSALTFTHHATDLILPGAANITTAAGDIAVLYEYASGDWRCISYTKASGVSIANDGNLQDLDTLGVVSSNSQMIVGTGSGAYAYESGSTLRTSIGVAIGSDVQAYDADTLKADTDDTLTGGFQYTADADGTKTSGTYTPAYTGGNVKTATNGGAHTLAPQSGDGVIVVQYTNDGSAGSITTSGFDAVSGDSFTTTDTNDFLCVLTVVGAFSHLHVTDVS